MIAALACPVDITGPWLVHALLTALAGFLLGGAIRNVWIGGLAALGVGTALIEALSLLGTWRELWAYLHLLHETLDPGESAGSRFASWLFCAAVPGGLGVLAFVLRGAPGRRRRRVENEVKVWANYRSVSAWLSRPVSAASSSRDARSRRPRPSARACSPSS